ncbi:MAG: S8 family serine peptidase [Eubacterium sp.]|nr:S8 family serine peptidase [Eubacterium sp.]
MKKTIGILMAIVLIVPIIAQNACSVFNETEQAVLDMDTRAFQKLVAEYDGEYIPDLVLDKDDGVKIKNNDFSVSADVILKNCAEEVPAPSKSQTANTEYAEKLGYEVSINEDSVTLSQPYQTHRLIVKGEDIDKLDSLEILPLFDGMYIVQFDDLESTLEALEYYNSQDDIEFANPDAVVSVADYNSGDVSAAALDSSTSSTSWGSSAIGFNTTFKLRMGLASSLPTVKVGVIDTGISLSHNQIKNRIIETGFNSSDTGKTGSERDDNGHGTHVAGIIAQNTLSNVKICGYKVLNRYGTGTIVMIMQGLNQAYHNGCKVVNLSLTGWNGTPTYDIYGQAYDFLDSHNIVCCVAAGNDGEDCSNLAPARYDECITVAAMDENDEIPEWSNYGKCVDIIAPGVEISSAYFGDDDTYIEMSGTSMATPFVTAAAANVLSKDTDAIPLEVKEFLQINGRDIDAPEHFYGAPALYLGNIKKFDMYEKPAAPTFSLEDGVYNEGAKLKITKSSGTDIYYQIYDYSTSNKTYPLTERTEYTGEIALDRPCIIVAIASYNSFLDSDITQGRYYIQYSSDENKFTIDENGTITGYSGNTANLVIPEEVNGITVTAIGENAFTQYDSKRYVNPDPTTNYLRSVTLPDSCTTIERDAFFGCRYMTDVYAGNLQNIGVEAFLNCYTLENVDFSSTVAIESNAFSNTGLKEVVSDSIESVRYCAFGGCSELTYIELRNLSELSENAFEGCENLSTVTLSNKLLSVGSDAFYGCTNLTDVYYDGTENEWNNIDIADNNDCLTNAAIHFLQSNPEDDCVHQWQIAYYENNKQDTIVVFICDKCGNNNRVSFSEHINTNYSLLDLNNDGIVNGRDLAYLMINY